MAGGGMGMGQQDASQGQQIGQPTAQQYGGQQSAQQYGGQQYGMPNFYSGFQSRFSRPNPFGGFMGYGQFGPQNYAPQSYQPMGWSNPYWRPQPARMPQMPSQQGTGIDGKPISSPPAIVQQYQQMQAAQQAQKKTDYETMMEQLRQSSQMDGGV